MNIDSLRDMRIDGLTKGIPGTVDPFPLSAIGAKNWNLLNQDLLLPLMVLKRSSLDHNAQIFGDYLRAHELSLAPHGKSTMAPHMFAEQLRDGAWGMSAATVSQMQVMRHFGIERVILANQLVGRPHVREVAAALDADPAFEVYCFVDSVAQLEQMQAHLDEVPPARPVRVLLEIGVSGGRTGVRTREEALALADAMLGTDPARIRFAGVAAFEGVVPGQHESADPVRAYADTVVDIARTLPAELYADLDEFVLTGGGSSFFDVMATRFQRLKLEVPIRIVLRSGCYITTDNGAYKSAQDAASIDPARSWQSSLRPALEAWGYVQSRPEPELAFLTMGKRDVPYDAGLPVPVKRYRPGQGFLDTGNATITAVNDQHAYVRLDADADWRVGDMVGCGISHPCTAFDKWRFLPVVDDDYNIVEGMPTFF